MSERLYMVTPDGYLVSPARQAKKDRALSGRQERKRRKKLKREGFDGGRLNKFGNTVHKL